MQVGFAAGVVVQVNPDDVLVEAVVAVVVGMEVRVGATELAEVIDEVVGAVEEVAFGSTIIVVVIILGRIVGKDDTMVGIVVRGGVTFKGNVIDVSESDGMTLERIVGTVVFGVLVRFGRIVDKGGVIVGSVGRVAVMFKDTVTRMDELTEGVTVKDTRDVVDGSTEDEILRRVLAVDESNDERMVLDGLPVPLEEPILVVLPGDIVVLKVQLDDALFDVVEARPMEEGTLVTVEFTFEVVEAALNMIGVVEATIAVVLGVTLVVLGEGNFVVDRICSVPV